MNRRSFLQKSLVNAVAGGVNWFNTPQIHAAAAKGAQAALEG